MKSIFYRAAFIAFAATFVASGLSSAWALSPTLWQPLDESIAQRGLPQAQDPLWSKLVKCKVSYDERKGTYSIAMTDDVKSPLVRYPTSIRQRDFLR